MTTVRITQQVVEVARQTPLASTPGRFTQLFCDVLRLGSPPASRAFPIKQAGRVTDNGGGTRVFPIDIA
ncbi:MAG: hypothetical protein ACXAEN_23715 [Candidatus Thorarchaeota archaeon]|jgi:hypothetical protein